MVSNSTPRPLHEPAIELAKLAVELAGARSSNDRTTALLSAGRVWENLVFELDHLPEGRRIVLRKLREYVQYFVEEGEENITKARWNSLVGICLSTCESLLEYASYTPTAVPSSSEPQRPSS